MFLQIVCSTTNRISEIISLAINCNIYIEIISYDNIKSFCKYPKRYIKIRNSARN